MPPKTASLVATLPRSDRKSLFGRIGFYLALTWVTTALAVVVAMTLNAAFAVPVGYLAYVAFVASATAFLAQFVATALAGVMQTIGMRKIAAACDGLADDPSASELRRVAELCARALRMGSVVEDVRRRALLVVARDAAARGEWEDAGTTLTLANEEDLWAKDKDRAFSMRVRAEVALHCAKEGDTAGMERELARVGEEDRKGDASLDATCVRAKLVHLFRNGMYAELLTACDEESAMRSDHAHRDVAFFASMRRAAMSRTAGIFRVSERPDPEAVDEQDDALLAEIGAAR